jgi:hypothetical protein
MTMKAAKEVEEEKTEEELGVDADELFDGLEALSSE